MGKSKDSHTKEILRYGKDPKQPKRPKRNNGLLGKLSNRNIDPEELKRIYEA